MEQDGGSHQRVNRATIGRDQARRWCPKRPTTPSPTASKERARVIVHGVDLSRSDALIADRDVVRAEVRAELGVDSRGASGPDSGQPAPREGLRRSSGRPVWPPTAAPPLRFAAVGRGPLEDELRERSGQLGLEGRLQFLGQRYDVLRLLTAADLFVLASRQEGLPVSLMEATSVGAAIVATSVGGVPQVITDGVDGSSYPPVIPLLSTPSCVWSVTPTCVPNSGVRPAAEHHVRRDLGLPPDRGDLP